MRFRLLLSIAAVLAGCGGDDDDDDDDDDLDVPSDLVGPDIALRRVVLDGEATTMGVLTLPLAGRDDERTVLDVVADLNGDGAFEAYDAAGVTQEERIVTSSPILVTDTRYGLWFELADAGLAAGSTVRVRVVLGEDAVPAGWDGTPPAGSESREEVIALEDLEVEDQASPADDSIGGGGGGSGEEFDCWLAETPGDLDLEKIFYRPGLPDTPQGPNTCVLHSIANSLAWLATANGFADRLTGVGANGGNFGVASSEDVQELGFHIDDQGQMGWDPDRGVPTANVFPGKDRFVAATGIPVETRRVDAGPQLFQEIQQAMRDGCDVEVVMTFGGSMKHMVTVSGFSDIEIGGAPSRTLVVHDSNQPTFNDRYVMRDDQLTIEGYPFDGRLQDPQLTFAMIECPVEPPVDEDPGTPHDDGEDMGMSGDASLEVVRVFSGRNQAGEPWVRLRTAGGWPPPADLYSWFVTVELFDAAGASQASATTQVHDGQPDTFVDGVAAEDVEIVEEQEGVLFVFHQPLEAATQFRVESGVQRENPGTRVTDEVGTAGSPLPLGDTREDP